MTAADLARLAYERSRTTNRQALPWSDYPTILREADTKRALYLLEVLAETAADNDRGDVVAWLKAMLAEPGA